MLQSKWNRREWLVRKNKMTGAISVFQLQLPILSPRNKNNSKKNNKKITLQVMMAGQWVVFCTLTFQGRGF